MVGFALRLATEHKVDEYFSFCAHAQTTLLCAYTPDLQLQSLLLVHQTYPGHCHAGPPEALSFEQVPAFFSTTATAPTVQLENQCAYEAFTMQLQDADGYSTVPSAKER